MDLGSHMLDLLDFLIRPITSVQGMVSGEGTARSRADDPAIVVPLLQQGHPDGCVAHARGGR